ncbi:hypothetical protein WFZ85_10890 [Flavobacterium sp. j3]|uniref:Uncharacterized protein n=1 Tax=Flavobacterium aureirubrum TaxID=3133147 RepID=A0ABU9N5Z6_9FLAO
MKNLLLLLICINLLPVAKIKAQTNANIKLEKTATWSPAQRFDKQYYYLPEIDAYYDVSQRKYIYQSNNAWVRSNTLPTRYNNYNLKKGKIVYITDYRGNTPFKYHKKHKSKYYHPQNNGKHKAIGQGKGHTKKKSVIALLSIKKN